MLKAYSPGEKALEIANDFYPDLVLLDIMMPGLNGYEVCQRLRKNRNNKCTKIVMVSAKTELSERLKAYEVGADDYITKPFDNHELLVKVKVYLHLKTIEEVNTMKIGLLKYLCSGTVSPLASIIKPLASLLDGDSDISEKSKINIAMGYSSAVSLQQTFEKTILLSSIKTGSMKLNFISENLVLVVRKVMEDLGPKIKLKNLEIHQVLPDCVMVRIDTLEIKRVIETIMDNAIRFSPQNGRLILEISEANDHVYLSIMDQGRGINSKKIPKMFQEFFPSIEDFSDIQWHGLNLSLAHLIISMHKGDIRVDTIKGKGTNMTVVLPSAHMMKSSNDLKTTIMVKDEWDLNPVRT